MRFSSEVSSKRNNLLSHVEHVLSLVTKGITMVFPPLTLPLRQAKIGGRKTTESVEKRNFSVILDEEPATTFKLRMCKETQLPR